MIYFDDDTRFAVREFDLMKSGKLNHKGLVQLHEAYMVRKYLILIMDLVEGKTLLDQFKGRHSATEDDVAFIIGELCETLNFLHQQNIVHLDLRPTNIRFEGRDIKLLELRPCAPSFRHVVCGHHHLHLVVWCLTILLRGGSRSFEIRPGCQIPLVRSLRRDLIRG